LNGNHFGFKITPLPVLMSHMEQNDFSLVRVSVVDDVDEHFPKPCIKALELKSVLNKDIFVSARLEYQGT